jgi:hypothetical protein
MKKILPILLLVFILFGSTLISPPEVTHGQQNLNPAPVPTGGLWVVDPEVTFIGKNAARSGHTLNWTLLNYQWSCVQKSSGSNCDNSDNPLSQFWQRIVFFVVAPMLILVILVTSAVIIITRGKSLTIMRFIPRFIAILVLIAFSYSLLQFLYQFFDLIQGFFLRTDITKPCPPSCIQDSDLLYVGWRYEDFVGLRLLGDYNAESAFMSLLLTKLTALTYFVMVGILLIRKIILWFFIIVSPIFPILLLYYPIRNTGKIWVGEFFRWLLYGPLFAIFLQGLVFMWRFHGVGGGGGIPLQFLNPAISDPAKIVYPTAVNILLGGPQQFVTPSNSVNLPETFMLYVVSLIMLWIVILLPWILLQIFLDYAANFAPGGNAAVKKFMNIVSNKMVPPSPAGYPPQPGGTTLNLPFTKKTLNIPIMPMPGGAAKTIIRETQQTGVATPINAPLVQVSAAVMNLADIPLPTMRDIARYDTALLSNNMNQKEEVLRIEQTLEKIANPVAATSTIERERYTNMRERLTQEGQQGNIIATSIMNAVNSAANNQSRKNIQINTTELSSVLQQIANPASTTNLVDRERMTSLHEMLSSERSENNSQLASTLLSVNDRTSSNEIEKIRESLMQAQQQSNSVASSVLTQISSTQKSSENVKELKAVLSQIANPASVTNSFEREKYTKLHDEMQKESQQNNNQLASSILSVNDKTSEKELEMIKERLNTQASTPVASSVNNAIQTTQIKKTLQQIANPALTTNTVDREKYTKLHDQLDKESKQNNNQLAQSILQVNDKTTTEELNKLREQLYQSKESSIASTVLSTVNNAVSQQHQSVKVRSVLQQVANPSTASAVDKEKISRLHEALKKESQNGDQLATSLLAVNERTSTADIQKLQEKLQTAREQGKITAKDVLDIAAKENVAQIPATNRIQNVTQEELEDVKKMWRDTYTNLEVPQGIAGRSEWIKDDIEKINTIIGNLNSGDQNKINEGVQEVSNILPFLLVGGFSQSDIVSYLTVKQEAAKETLQTITTEEETKVTVETKHATASQTMTASIEEPTVSASTPTFETTNIITPEVSNEILAMVNIKLPAMRDIARLETMHMVKDKSQYADVQQTREVLEKISNPATVVNVTEREKYEKLHESLIEESQKGNTTAEIILSAAGSTSQRTVKTVLSQIANPASVTRSKDKEQFNKLHEQLLKASQEGNELATSILGVKEATITSDIEKLNQKLKDSKEKGEPLAVAITDALSEPVASPGETRLQTVTQEDYDEIKKIWEENYRTLPVPFGFKDNKEGRIEWLQRDIEEIQATIDVLQASDTKNRNEGLKKVGTILPFLLLGGFSYEEIVKYVNVKLEAAKTVLGDLKQSEEKEEKVDVNVKTQEAAKTQEEQEEIAD